jgi:hypothetical protein
MPLKLNDLVVLVIVEVMELLIKSFLQLLSPFGSQHAPLSETPSIHVYSLMLETKFHVGTKQ